jgi:hypothetical protein
MKFGEQKFKKIENLLKKNLIFISLPISTKMGSFKYHILDQN